MKSWFYHESTSCFRIKRLFEIFLSYEHSSSSPTFFSLMAKYPFTFLLFLLISLSILMEFLSLNRCFPTLSPLTKCERSCQFFWFLSLSLSLSFTISCSLSFSLSFSDLYNLCLFEHMRFLSCLAPLQTLSSAPFNALSCSFHSLITLPEHPYSL